MKIDFRDSFDPNTRITLICELASKNFLEGFTWSESDYFYSHFSFLVSSYARIIEYSMFKARFSRENDDLRRLCLNGF